MDYDVRYMRRALELAARGQGFTAPNPMVGAVIVAPDGRIIGEGWHRRCGEGHAEVNAVASVSDADRPLLRESTIYVTLEPCSHYGKTPPCSLLIINEGIPKVVVGAGDPNPKVNGRGIRMLREAGIEVVTGVLARESVMLNHVFFTSQIAGRPMITLKWARSADGFMDAVRGEREPAYAFSTPLTQLGVMKLRGENEAVLTTAATVIADNPRLTLRNWAGRQPCRFVLDRRGIVGVDCGLRREGALFLTASEYPELLSDDPAEALEAPFRILRRDFGITSVLVEAGPRYLAPLLEAGLWDRVRMEVSPVVLGAQGTHPAPLFPEEEPGDSVSREVVDGNEIVTLSRFRI